MEDSRNIHIDIPEGAKYVLNELNKAGYEAYVVGGSVRDAVLGREPSDWDVTTNALPLQVKAVFPKTVDTGLQHGTVTVIYKGEGYEVTTYRVDGVYQDHRRPEEVTFTASLREDMKRRDFTINAMAYNDEEGLVDYFGGREDLKAGIIRAVGDPYERFDEDALRILRAMRFAAQLGFEIDAETMKAMEDRREFLKDISPERIRVELTKLLVSDHVELLYEVGYKLGITSVVLPEYDRMVETTQENPHHMYNVGIHCLKATSFIENDPVLRWTALLHDVSKPDTKTMDDEGICHFRGHAQDGADKAKGILRRLHFDNDTMKKARELIYYHDYNWGEKVNKKIVRRAASKVGPEYMEDLFKVQRADVMAQSTYLQKEKLESLDRIIELYAEILKDDEALTIKDLEIDGRVLMDELGVNPGPKLGEILSTLLDRVIEEPELNNREDLLRLAREVL